MSGVTLTEFLLARLADDEQVARAAAMSGSASWTLRDDDSDPWTITSTNDVVVRDTGVPSDSEAAHIARHDPARVLAEVAAKRRIVELHAPLYEGLWDTPLVCRTCEDRERHDAAWYPCDTLRPLALPYADHESFDPAWTP